MIRIKPEKPERIYHRICKRCEKEYETTSKNSDTCANCRNGNRKGWTY